MYFAYKYTKIYYEKHGNNKKVIELLEKIIQILVNLSFDFNLYIDAYELNKKLEKIRSKNKFATNGG